VSRVTPDVLEGEVAITSAGQRARRVFQVSELAGGASRRLADAAVASGVPRVGEKHPVLASAVVTAVRARASSDPTIAYVDVEYETPSSGDAGIAGWRVEILSDLITETTTTDVNGRLMGTTYTRSIQLNSGGLTSPPSWGSITTRLTHQVEVQRPTFSLVFTRRVAGFPFATARRFAGVVNASTFQGEPADRWLANVESVQQDDGTHRVRITATFNRSGWQARLTHREQGIVPADVRTGNGLDQVQVYAREDFGALGLPSV